MKLEAQTVQARQDGHA